MSTFLLPTEPIVSLDASLATDIGSRCYVAMEEQIVVTSILRAFPDEFAGHVELGRCPRPRRLPIPELIDLADGRAVYDEPLWRKQPDSTYAPEDVEREVGDDAEHRP